MSYPSVTNTFIDATPLDATELNTNFNDIVNGVTDSSKNLNVKDISLASNLELTSTLVIGTSASFGSLEVTNTTTFSDDLIINSSILKILSFSPEDKTITAGVLTPTKSSTIVNGETGAADDLDTITVMVDGTLLLLKRKSTSGDITIKNGIGNIICGSDRVLSTNSLALLIYDAISTKWQLLFYEAN